MNLAASHGPRPAAVCFAHSRHARAASLTGHPKKETATWKVTTNVEGARKSVGKGATRTAADNATVGGTAVGTTRIARSATTTARAVPRAAGPTPTMADPTNGKAGVTRAERIARASPPIGRAK